MDLGLRIYPDSALREVCAPIEKFDATLHSLLDGMKEIMDKYNGIGLAANQVGMIKRIFIADVAAVFNEDYIEEFGSPAPEDQKLIEFINPVITKKEGKITWNEGCLSFPQTFFEIERPSHILIKAYDRFGKPFEVQAKNILAVCCQHEFDHLEGKVFLDYVSQAKRNSVTSRLKKLKSSGSKK